MHHGNPPAFSSWQAEGSCLESATLAVTAACCGSPAALVWARPLGLCCQGCLPQSGNSKIGASRACLVVSCKCLRRLPQCCSWGKGLKQPPGPANVSDVPWVLGCRWEASMLGRLVDTPHVCCRLQGILRSGSERVQATHLLSMPPCWRFCGRFLLAHTFCGQDGLGKRGVQVCVCGSLSNDCCSLEGRACCDMHEGQSHAKLCCPVESEGSCDSRL